MARNRKYIIKNEYVIKTFFKYCSLGTADGKGSTSVSGVGNR